jgi:replication-associated recombination protein RarA
MFETDEETARTSAPLYERYRPATWAEVIGQDKVVNRARQLAQRSGLAGKAYWLSGQSGTGKTTIARLIAAEVADEFSVEELDAQRMTPARLAEVENHLTIRGWGEKGGKAVIVNEAHGLSSAAIRQLLVCLENIPPHVVWIFTTTIEGQENLFGECEDASPLLSGCIRLELARRGLAEAFAQRAQEIAQREGLDGRPIKDYIRLAQEHRNNFRAVLSAVEGGEMLAQ